MDVTVELVVGFDLDMTLLDSRPGIAAVYAELAAQTGVSIDTEAVVSRLGPPVEQEMAYWFPPDLVQRMADRYRAMYLDHAIGAGELLPGAVAAIEAVRRHGGRVVVVTGKHTPNARAHLEHFGLDVDVLVGGRWGEGKTEAMRELGVTVYVGDHVADVISGRGAGARTVGVTTGTGDTAELLEAGADAVVEDLTDFPDWLEEHVRQTRVAVLLDRLSGLGGLMVAFSGGADSAFLLAAAVRALGAERVVAATAISPSLPDSELVAATAFTHGLGVRHLTPRTDEMSRAGYRANNGDRCYFCKAELLDTLGPLALGEGTLHIATGTNADDALAGFRPGIRAAAERRAITPLLDAGLTKWQVRETSRLWGLTTWDKPAAACLSSRVAFGISITPSRLSRIERAEAGLRRDLVGAGYAVRDLRVRDLGEQGARVEVDVELVDVLQSTPELLRSVEGFSSVTVDPRGFRSGAMNALLADPERYR